MLVWFTEPNNHRRVKLIEMDDLATFSEHSASEHGSKSRKTSLVVKLSNRLAIFVFAIPVASYFWLIHHYGVNDVYLDQWGDVGILRHSYSGTLTLGTLWSQHGEERLFFPNLIVLALGYTTHFNILGEEYLSAILLCLSALFVVLSHKRRSSRGWIWYCPVPIVMLSMVQSYSTLFGFQMAWYLLILMLAAALYLLDREAHSDWALAGAIVAAVIGSFSSLPGLFIWPAGLVLLYQRRFRLAQVIAWCSAAIAAGCVFAYHYDLGRGVPAHLSGFDLPGEAINAFFRSIGGVFGIQLAHASPSTSKGELLLGVLLFLLAGYAVVTRGIRRDEFSGAPVGVALICFGVLYAAALVYGRAWAGPVAVTQSQYATFTLLIVVGTYLALLGPAASPSAFVVPSKLGRVIALVLGGVIGLQVVLGTINGLSVASSFHSKQFESNVVLVEVGKVPDSAMQGALQSFWLPPSLVRSYARTLELHHLSVFDGGDISSYRRQFLAQQKAGAFIYTPPPTPLVLNPRVMMRVKGDVVIDFLFTGDTHPSRVEFHLMSGMHDVNLGLATASPFGWEREWNTAQVPDGTYQIQTTVHDEHGITKSTPMTVTVDNP